MEDICVSSLFELLFEIAFTYLHKHRHTLILHSLPTNLPSSYAGMEAPVDVKNSLDWV